MIPKVTVIVPNYNHAAFLEQRLESIYSQSFQDFEVILLDDLSTDNSKEILLKYKEHPKTSHCIINEVNSGSPFKQWDKGIALAKGKYVWIAESDDYCSTYFLETMVNSLEKKENITLAYCQSYRVNSHNDIKGTWFFHTKEFKTSLFENDFVMDGNEFIEKFLIHKNVIPNVSAVLFNKKELQKIRPLVLEPYLRYNADWYYYIQLLCHGKVAFVAKPENYFRFHESSLIAGAGEESGWVKIFKMEMKGRQLMREYLKKSKPVNLKRIISESFRGDERLKRNTISGFIDKKQYAAARSIVEGKPDLILYSLKYFLEKRILK